MGGQLLRLNRLITAWILRNGGQLDSIYSMASVNDCNLPVVIDVASIAAYNSSLILYRRRQLSHHTHETSIYCKIGKIRTKNYLAKYSDLPEIAIDKFSLFSSRSFCVMKLLGSCHLIINRNCDDHRCICHFIHIDYFGGETILLCFWRGFYPQVLTCLLAVFVIILSIFTRTPAPIHAHSHAYPRLSAYTPAPIRSYLCTLPLTRAHSRTCWCMNIDGRMTKALLAAKLMTGEHHNSHSYSVNNGLYHIDVVLRMNFCHHIYETLSVT